MKHSKTQANKTAGEYMELNESADSNAAHSHHGNKESKPLSYRSDKKHGSDHGKSSQKKFTLKVGSNASSKHKKRVYSHQMAEDNDLIQNLNTGI